MSEEDVQLALSTVCSGLEYWVERGEIEHLTDVLTEVRYKHPKPMIDHFDVVVNGRIIRFQASDAGVAPVTDGEGPPEAARPKQRARVVQTVTAKELLARLRKDT